MSLAQALKDLEADLLALQDQYKWAAPEDRPAISERYRQLNRAWLAAKGAGRTTKEAA